MRGLGVPEFAGLKITAALNVCATYPAINNVRIEGEDMIFAEPGVIGGGGNSGFQALNLAAQFGARKVILLGYDMHVGAGLHWHGPHKGGLNNPAAATSARWRERLDGQAVRLSAFGVQVLNATADSALVAYPKVTLQEALQC